MTSATTLSPASATAFDAAGATTARFAADTTATRVEYAAFLSVAAIVQFLIGDGAFALRRSGRKA